MAIACVMRSINHPAALIVSVPARAVLARNKRPGHALIQVPSATRKAVMSEIRNSHGICTQITTVKLPPDNQDEVLNLMKERARFMASQPGFISVNLHRSKDGSHVVNYIQWQNADQLAAAHRSSEFRKKWPRFGQIAEEIEPCLYEVVFTAAA
jgi:heme-degrading monooxygenase HmoA